LLERWVDREFPLEWDPELTGHSTRTTHRELG
jgi:hypothetical protein